MNGDKYIDIDSYKDFLFYENFYDKYFPWRHKTSLPDIVSRKKKNVYVFYKLKKIKSENKMKKKNKGKTR